MIVKRELLLICPKGPSCIQTLNHIFKKSGHWCARAVQHQVQLELRRILLRWLLLRAYLHKEGQGQVHLWDWRPLQRRAGAFRGAFLLRLRVGNCYVHLGIDWVATFGWVEVKLNHMRGVLPLKVQFGELEHGLLSHHMRWQTELHLNILEYTFRSGRAFIADSNLHFHSNHLALVIFRN